MLLVSLRMDSTYVKESMKIKWVSETGIVENIATVVKDFKETRGLLVSVYSCHSNYVFVMLVCLIFMSQNLLVDYIVVCRKLCAIVELDQHCNVICRMIPENIMILPNILPYLLL